MNCFDIEPLKIDGGLFYHIICIQDKHESKLIIILDLNYSITMVSLREGIYFLVTNSSLIDLFL